MQLIYITTILLQTTEVIFFRLPNASHHYLALSKKEIKGFEILKNVTRNNARP